METYLKQLIEDFRESAKRVPDSDVWLANVNATSDEPYDEISCCELYVEGNPDKTLGEIFGISQEAIPTENRLIDKQIELLYDEMENMWVAWHFIPSFPEATPIRVRYQMLRDIWNEKHLFMDIGDSIFDFCDGCCDECSLKMYCTTADEVLNDDL